jgi:4-hydroxybenzoate polyprenyltransferase
MINRLRTYGRFVKIEHSVFAFPLLLAGAVVGTGGARSYALSRMALVICAGIGARTVAFTFNRILDSDIDRRNPRTSRRELPAGAMTLAEAVGVGFAGALIYFGAAYALLGGPGLGLGIFPLAVFAVYPFLKRFTALAHLGVGLSLALAPVGGWLAVFSAHGALDPSLHQILFLGFFTFLWVSGFDIIYSTMDEDFDRHQGLHSLPAKLGRKKALWISAAFHMAAFVTLGILYVSYFRTPVAGVLLGAAGVLLFLEQHLADNVELAFFKINGVISFLILAFIWTGVARL